MAQYGAASGASNALSMLAEYYIKRANQYHPVIQLNPGAVVDLMFLQPFNLAPDATEATISTPSSMPGQNQNSLGLGNLNLGSNVSPVQAQQIRSEIQQAMQNAQRG